MRIKWTRFLSGQNTWSIILSILVTTTISGVCPQGASSADGGLQIEVLSHTDETDKNLEFLRRGISTIPLSVQEQIRGAGIKVVLTPRFIFDEPEQSGKTVFRNGQTSDNIGGEFQPGKKRVLIPERASWGNSAPRPQGNYVVKVVRHELGHAWDHSRGGISKSRGYLAAYDIDFGRLGGEQKQKWAYYITGTATSDAAIPTASGHAELLASLLEALCTPIEQSTKEKQLLEDFPAVTAYLISIEPSLQGLPKHLPSEQTVRKQDPKEISETARAESSSELQQAIQLLQNKRYTEAAVSLTSSIRQNPSKDRAYLLRGNAYMWMVQYRQALADYTSYIRLKPDDPQGFELRAKAYGWLGEAANEREDERHARLLQVQTTSSSPNNNNRNGANEK